MDVKLQALLDGITEEKARISHLLDELESFEVAENARPVRWEVEVRCSNCKTSQLIIRGLTEEAGCTVHTGEMHCCGGRQVEVTHRLICKEPE